MLKNLDSYRILFPKDMDANEYALNVSSPQQALAKVIRTAQWMGNGVENKITKKRKNHQQGRTSYTAEFQRSQRGQQNPISS